ncbi:MAG: hypothetical protein F9K32_02195 [Desulfobulbaceae bacterium]|nr:MAG: hypothetical protein F9K32_02195 [Desulfobulbaceae bacterium]
MYRLWWERERVDYLGKPVQQQRVAIWKHAGLPGRLLATAENIGKTWPVDATYTATGDRNQLSYLKYLLIPRLPTGSSVYAVEANGGYAPAGLGAAAEETLQGPSSISGLLLSFFSVVGMSLVLGSRVLRKPFSLPELAGCVCLLLMGCVVASRALSQTAIPAFFLLALAGLGSWAMIISAWLRKKRRSSGEPGGSAIFRRISLNLSWKTVSLLVIIAISVVWAALMSVIVVPDDWDAWAIWAAKAKVLALGNGPLFDVGHFGHADYPLLWPSLWAFSGWLGGGWEEMWSRGWGTVFFVFCLWEITVVIERETGRRDIGLLGAALFASMPMVPLIVSWSYAETPFWMMTLCSFGCLMLWRGSRESVHLVVAAALAAGAAYTKNEGILFFGMSALWILIVAQGQRIRTLILFSTVFSLLYLPWAIWIHCILNLGSHATAGIHLDHENVVRVADRIPKAMAAIGGMWSDIRRWNLVLWAVGIATVLGCLKREFRENLFVPAGMLLGYFVIVVFHTDDIYWQVGTSWDRLTVQVMPMIVVVICSRWRWLKKGGLDSL